jgi:hypothetical protein
VIPSLLYSHKQDWHRKLQWARLYPPKYGTVRGESISCMRSS